MILHHKSSYKRLFIQHAKLLCLCRQIFADIYLRGMHDRSMRSWMEFFGNLLVRCKKTCLTSPLEYKYCMIFRLALGIICTIQIAVVWQDILSYPSSSSLITVLVPMALRSTAITEAETYQSRQDVATLPTGIICCFPHENSDLVAEHNLGL